MSKKSIKNWKGLAAVLGIDWGDSGKGRLVDDLAGNAQIVARYNGGSNTGHTVENKFGKFALHIIPSGIFHKNAKCLVGRNVAVDLDSLVDEINLLRKAGVTYNNLVIDSQASLTMPWHKLRDGIREKMRGTKKVGTTGKGTGPTYADRTERVGLLVADLFSSDFKDKLTSEVEIQNKLFSLRLNARQILDQYISYKKTINNYIGDTADVVRKAIKNSKNILFEGAQGYFLDIDAGTYPFVTSSNPGMAGILRSFDVHPADFDEVIGITKAYTTRVGEGPMPTRIEGKIADIIVKNGHEVGTTTGRIRSPGWLDLVLIKEAVTINRITAIAVTKLDVLSGIKTLKFCIGYKLKNQPQNYKPHNADHLSRVTPIYQECPGWAEDISACRNRTDLPKNAKAYIKIIEDIVGIPVKFIGVGPKRGEVIYE